MCAAFRPACQAARSNWREEMPYPWQETTEALPPEGLLVGTKIEDAKGARNEFPLRRSGRLWFFGDGSMYVYYTPTHWRLLERA